MAANTTGFGEGSYDLLIFKIKANGVVEWSHTYGTNFYEGLMDFVKVPSGGYAISGESRAHGAV